MSESANILTVVYAQRSADYHILSIFGPSGLIDEASLEKNYEQLSLGKVDMLADGQIGSFQEFEKLQKLSFNICQDSNLAGVSLVSLDQYNELLLECHQSEDLIRSLVEGGNYMENPDVGRSGFFNKIFN